MLWNPAAIRVYWSDLSLFLILAYILQQLLLPAIPVKSTILKTNCPMGARALGFRASPAISIYYFAINQPTCALAMTSISHLPVFQAANAIRRNVGMAAR